MNENFRYVYLCIIARYWAMKKKGLKNLYVLQGDSVSKYLRVESFSRASYLVLRNVRFILAIFSSNS